MKGILFKRTFSWLFLFVMAVFLFAEPCAVASDWHALIEWFPWVSKPVHKVITKLVTLHEDSDIWGLAFSPDGKYLATDSPNSPIVHIWDWRNKRIVHSYDKGPGAGIILSATPILYSPDGRLLADCHRLARHNVVINIWNTRTWTSVKNVSATGGGCSAMIFTPDSQFLIRVFDGYDPPGVNNVIVYSTRTWQIVWGLHLGPFGPSTITMSPDGMFIALGGEKPGSGFTSQSQAKIVDLVHHVVVRTIAPLFPEPPPDNVNGRQVHVESAPLRALAWSPDGVYLAVGIEQPPTVGADAVRIFEVRTGKKVLGEPGPWGTNLYRLRYSPNSKYLIESAIGHPVIGHTIVGHYIEIWDGGHRRLLERISGEAGSVAISRDNKYVAMGGDKKIIVWKMK